MAHGRSAARTSENSCPDNRAASTGNIGRIAVVLDGMDLTDVQWAVLEPTFRPRRRPDGRGRPWTDPRAVMNGVLWVLRTGVPWHDLPSRYPPSQTCHRRFQRWQRSGRLDRLLQRLAEDLRDRGKIDLSEAFVDATFASAKKGALKSVQRAVAKAPRSWRSATAAVFLSPCTWPALHRMSHTSSPPPSTRASSPTSVQLACARILLRAFMR